MRTLALAIANGVLLLASSALAASPAPFDPLFAESFESGIAGFGPIATRVPAGATNATTAAYPLKLTLSDPAIVNTFIAITSSDPARLTVNGGGVTVLAGETTALVRVDAAPTGAGSLPVTLTAQLGNLRAAGVRVEGALNETDVPAEADTCTLISPSTLNLFSGAPTPMLLGQLFEMGVTEPAGAPVGWYAEVGYGIAGSDPRALNTWTFFPAAYNAQVGSNDEFQASVAAPSNRGNYVYTYRFSKDDGGSYTYCDLNGAGSVTGQTFDPNNLGTMTVSKGLVINEIDYDNVGTDDREFIEVLNTGVAPINLAGKQLVLVNGASNTVYSTIDLSPAGSLGAGQYLVVRSGTVVPAPGSLSIVFPNPQDNIQNGAPDGVVLIDADTSQLLDALSYEGSITAATIAGLGVVSLVEGTALPVSTADTNLTTGSLARLPDGTDNDNAATDWNFTATLTPGAANVP